jgi:hypothetical protein
LVKASLKSVDRGCRTQIRITSPQTPSSKTDAVPLPIPLKKLKLSKLNLADNGLGIAEVGHLKTISTNIE